MPQHMQPFYKTNDAIIRTEGNLVVSDSALQYYHSKQNFRTVSTEINSSHKH